MMGSFQRKRLMPLLCTLVLAWATAGFAAEPGEVLLEDDFKNAGSIEPAKWEAAPNSPGLPSCNRGFVANAPNRNWNSKKVFSKPVSVEFSGVFMTRLPDSDSNHLGLAPNGYGPDMVSWVFSGNRTGPKKRLVPYRRIEGQSFWSEGFKKAIDLTKLPDITKEKNAINLRINWWPGKIARYYMNGALVVEYSEDIPDIPVPAGVRDESVYFRIGAIKVTAITKSAGAILGKKAAAGAAAGKAQKDVRQARINERVQRLTEQFPRLRIVIGGPCYFWGIDPVIRDELRAAGMDVLAWPDAPLLTEHKVLPKWELLKRYNVLIFGDRFYHLIQPDPNTGEIPKQIRDQVPALRRFLESGGGIWFCGLGEQNWGRSSHALNYILKELNLGAEVVGEVVRDSQAIKTPAKRFPYYAWVDVLPDPLTQGVTNMLHPSGVITSLAGMGVCPITKLSPEWRVLMKARPTAASFTYDRADDWGRELVDTPGAVKSSPILCAVRQAGKGRVVLWPTWSNFTVTGGSGGMVVDGEHGGRISDGALLMENLLCWLAEPGLRTRAVGTFVPKTYKRPEKHVDIDKKLQAWAKPGRRDYSRQFKGLIGAHSNLSDGQSSPEAMIAAAKKAGYDFIAFTEDLAKMTEEEWKQLLAVCDKANKEDTTFIAYPGLDFLDDAGNRGLHFGQRYWIKDDWRSKEHPGRIRWWYKLAYAANANARAWLPRVLVRSRTNAKRPWNQGLWNLFSAYGYEAGKLVDDSFHEWRPLIGRHVYFLNTGIVATHTVRSVAEIAAAAQPGLYQTYIKAQNLPQVLSRITGCTGPGWMGCFPIYISAGPEILDFRCYVAEIGGEICFDLAIPGNDRGWLHILAQSDVGLKEISIYDCERLVRRFRPEGKKVFENFMAVHADSYHSFSMTVTDQQGRKAVGWNAFLQIAEKVHRRCGDNYNWMTTGKGAGSLIPPKFSYQLHETTHGWKTREEEAQSPARPQYKEGGGMYHHGGLSASINCYVPPFQNLLVDGAPRRGRFPVATLDFTTIGRYGIIVTNHIRQDYAVKKRPKFGSYACYSGPHKVTPCPWPADLKQFVPFRKPDGAYIARYQGKVRFTNKVTDPDGKPIKINLGSIGNPSAEIFEVMKSDGTSERHRVRYKTVTGEIPVGGYICWYDAKGDGVGGIIALSPGVQYSYSRKYAAYHLQVNSPAKPGTEVTWDVIYVMGDRSTSNSNAQMEDIRVGMGLAGTPTLYEVRQLSGKVVNQEFTLTLAAADYGFSGRIVKTTTKTLPIHLPVMIQGLNPRWDAIIWYKGKTHLHTVDRWSDDWGLKTWRWRVATYEPRFDEIQHIPILEGSVGYCQVDTDKQDPDVFIGNPLVCDQAEVFLTLVKAERSKCTFEINNPTDNKLTCIVRPAKGFGFTGQWSKKISLPAGGWQAVSVGAR